MPDRPADPLATLRTTLGLLSSMVMSGEPWDRHSIDAKDAALAALADVERLVEAARLLVKRDTFDMRLIAIREHNLIDALAPFKEES